MLRDNITMLALETVLRLFGPTNGPLTPYSTEMEWGQVIIFFAVACFAAIVLFMVYRKA